MKGSIIIRLLGITYFSFQIVLSGAQDLTSLYRQSQDAYEKAAFDSFLYYNLEALKLHPSQPTILYNTAAAYCLNGNLNSAYKLIKKLLSWNSQLNFDQDPDFKVLFDDPSFSANYNTWKNKFNEQYDTFTEWEIAIQNCHAEDLAFLGTTLIVSDVHQGLLRFYDMNQREWQTPISLDGGGMAVVTDPINNRIYASAVMLPQYYRFDSLRESTSILYVVDAMKREIIETLAIPGKSIIGSMAIVGNELWMTSSAEPELIIIDLKQTVIKERFILTEAFNLQGITYHRQFDQLFIADYLKGVGQVNLRGDREVNWLMSDNYLLKGIDGLTIKDSLHILAIQNGSTPLKLVQIRHKDGEVEEVIILETFKKEEGEPTNGKYIDGSGFYFIKNSPWPFYSEDNHPHYEEWRPLAIGLIKE